MHIEVTVMARIPYDVHREPIRTLLPVDSWSFWPLETIGEHWDWIEAKVKTHGGPVPGCIAVQAQGSRPAPNSLVLLETYEQIRVALAHAGLLIEPGPLRR